MDPISKEIFSYDFHRFVTQDLVRITPPEIQEIKPFNLKPPEKAKKAKKDAEKEREKKKKKSPLDQFRDSV